MTAARSQSATKAINPINFSPAPGAAQRRAGIIPLSYGHVGILVAGFDFLLIIALSAITSAGYQYVSYEELGHLKSFSTVGFACAILFGLAMQSQRLYRPNIILHPIRVTRAILTTWMSVFCALLVVAFLAKITWEFSRGTAICFFLAGAVALPLSRVAAQRALRFVIATNCLADRRRVVLFGDAHQLSARGVFGNLGRHGYSVVEQFGVRPSSGKQAIEYREILASIELLKRFIRQNRVDEIFLVFDNSDERTIDLVVEQLKSVPLPVRLLFDQRISALLSRSVSDLGAAKAIKLQSGPLTLSQQVVKRAFDAILAFLGLILLSPLLVVIAMAIKVDSAGPIMFRQRRAGFGGRTFRIYKFRSMTTLDDGGVIKQATRNDQRVTRVGRFLRKTSLDELPQLLNVLQGDMSLVGPRPHALSHDNEYDKLIATYALRHHMKPGITGWAQVNGCRGETSSLSLMEARVQHDLWYIGHWSLMLDITAIALTVVQVFRPKNVY